MIDKVNKNFAWEKFEQSGKVNDYLNYISFENKISSFNGEKENNAVKNTGNSFRTT